MSDLSFQKRLASEILGVGVSRIRIDPKRIEDVEAAITREEVKKLIRDGAIWVEPVHGIAGYSSRVRHAQRVKGRRRGHGKRKGTKEARLDSKELWMGRIRKIRRYLRYLRDKKLIDARTYRRLYMLAKGGYFNSLSSLKLYLRENNILKEAR
ncbi:50S ribosomal protein L19e [Desulfurococcus mucosus]|uniref:Large ribosomal subunit protein eL19 n=1 Tax=Desulfurococcus mucosus (strain ATCC 35584 / DSM 2162 / JCM 9187 / O7/1) TaxID=765177 RepID=E8RAM2_DESM0|nr:50S ribosomal protein L19e [Desulfurococcus mucosus]ADV65458.1 LSU ribosomal protein L19E [Desulfurococcus mucosus DSM 2162]